MSTLHIRPETPTDIPGIRAVIEQAFAELEHSDGSEPAIVDKLRDDAALHLSLVAETAAGVVGHVAISAVSIGDGRGDWFGLGPISVHPDLQGGGIGSALMRAALAQLRAAGAGGVVLLGEPAYYHRFGFEVVPGLTYPPAPAEYFMALLLNDTTFPQGVVEYHAAFDS
ncbi:GNAT family N-acetyltransferase [Corynebacterium sp. A21]|uniref:GNAT family N-acetyltransferase n=1 Tax=Corynebacterium sp. A21 TaxID=3457318 RepID=UPI003FD3B7CC